MQTITNQLLATAVLLGVCACSGGHTDDLSSTTGGSFSDPFVDSGAVDRADAGDLSIQGSGGEPLTAGSQSTGGMTATESGGGMVVGTGGVEAATGGVIETGGTGQGQPDHQMAPACEVPGSDSFRPNDSVGPGGTATAESAHFQIYGNASNVDLALTHLETAHKCFVEDWCFRSPGQSVHEEAGPLYKFNVYAVSALGGAAGVMQYDDRAGVSYLEVLGRSIAEPRVVVHEFGHALTLTEYGWVDQTRTGAWWETVANWVADTYMTSAYCDDAREAHGVSLGRTVINLDKTIGQSNMMIVSDQNLYEAWPFLTYLTHNPDNYPGLGRMIVPRMFRNHMGNNETPLHVLERLAAPTRVQTILGRYWARMAYLDIGHVQAQEVFFSIRDSLNFANLDASGNETYRVKSTRRPAYGGANIVPLDGQGELTVDVTNAGNGLQESNFTATLAIRAASGAVRYVDLPDGAGTAGIGNDEEASLVVVNTPDTLYQYDPFRAGSPEMVGLNYSVHITGAVPAN